MTNHEIGLAHSKHCASKVKMSFSHLTNPATLNAWLDSDPPPDNER